MKPTCTIKSAWIARGGTLLPPIETFGEVSVVRAKGIPVSNDSSLLGRRNRVSVADVLPLDRLYDRNWREAAVDKNEASRLGERNQGRSRHRLCASTWKNGKAHWKFGAVSLDKFQLDQLCKGRRVCRSILAAEFRSL
jgi:hypothetical protein